MNSLSTNQSIGLLFLTITMNAFLLISSGSYLIESYFVARIQKTFKPGCSLSRRIKLWIILRLKSHARIVKWAWGSDAHLKWCVFDVKHSSAINPINVMSFVCRNCHRSREYCYHLWRVKSFESPSSTILKSVCYGACINRETRMRLKLKSFVGEECLGERMLYWKLWNFIYENFKNLSIFNFNIFIICYEI